MNTAPTGMRTGPVTAKPLFEIERERRWRIWALFGLLLAMMFAAVAMALQRLR